MNTANQKCNAFASLIGIFLHGHNVPEKVIKVLSRMGVCISQSVIHDAIKSLSKDAEKHIRSMGQTLLVGYAYDNFDVNLKSAKPTIQAQSVTPLKHLTSALLFALPKGTQVDDLRCAAKLWDRSRLNDTQPDSRPRLEALPSYDRVLTLHPQYRSPDENGLNGRDRFNIWMFMSDITGPYGPEEFRELQSKLQLPEIIDAVPNEKAEIRPARAMKHSNSSVSGNLDTIDDILAQAGVGFPDADRAAPDSSAPLDANLERTIKDISEYVVLFHGDLSTGERIRQAMRQRAIELSRGDRKQFVVFVFGLFHLKMPCADAIWRIFIKPSQSHEDPTSVMGHVRKIRPKDFGTVGSDPGFRRMHQIITHDGRCRRLECWRVEIEKQTGCKTLEEFAKTKPTFEQLMKIARALVRTYVADQAELVKMQRELEEERDQCFENGLLINAYYLLYEELSYAMNAGDIGRVETTFAAWIPIFRGINKHKYAAELIRHVTNITVVYPKKLRQVLCAT